jgi:hypothetical protein
MNDTDRLLIPAKHVRRRYGVCGKTLTRWASIGFPAPAVINHQRHWWLSELETWERSRVAGRNGIAETTSEVA